MTGIVSLDRQTQRYLMQTARLLAAVFLLCAMARAETVKDREGAVRKDRATMASDARWIYNDVARGFAEAQRTGKPLLVVLRCVPCLACMGIDASVIAEPSLAPWLDRFVCVRVINANALDLTLFQFDYDLSFSTMFFAADGTVLGRFGSWSHQKDARDTTTAGYRAALEAVLALHRDFPGNRSALAGKQGVPTPFKTPVEIPALAGKYQRELDWDGKVVQSCVHCHQIGDAFRASYRAKGESLPGDLIYPMPPPETIGLTLAADGVAHVKSVASGSLAASGGVGLGDDLVSISGQPLVSIADVAWALHRAAESGPLAIVVRRGGVEKTLAISLPVGWRAKADISRRVGTWEMRAMALGGLKLEDLADDTRAGRNIPQNAMALSVNHVGQYGAHALAKNAGFIKDDVLIECDGLSNRISESELIGRLLRTRKPGELVAVAVLRDAARIELSFPMQ